MKNVYAYGRMNLNRITISQAVNELACVNVSAISAQQKSTCGGSSHMIISDKNRF